jgi:hypothetical protein
MKNVSPSSQQIRAMANLFLIPGDAYFVASQHHLRTSQRAQSTQILVAKPEECSSFVVMRQFYNGVSHGWLKGATGKEKHHLFSVVVGDFRPLFKQDGFSSMNRSPKKTFFRRHIRGKKCSGNKLATSRNRSHRNGGKRQSLPASGMRQLPGLRFETFPAA